MSRDFRVSVRIAALSREDRADQESSANVDPGIGRIHAQQRHVTPHETNHFVRLHPSTARKLYDDAVLTLVPTSRSPDFTRSVDGWDLAETVISSRCSSGVEFLPLEIQRSNGDLVYASYNGGDCLGRGTLDLPTTLGCHPDEIVKVSLLSFVQNAKSVHVQPVSECDWENINISAEWLESGALLSQISIVYPNQELEISSRQGLIRIRVLPESFVIPEPLWPDDPESSPNCLRLVQDTEIIVKPIPATGGSRSATLKIVDVLQDFPVSLQELAKQRGIPLCGVPSRTCLIHPRTYRSLCSIGNLTKDCKYAEIRNSRRGGTNSTVRVLVSESVSEGDIAVDDVLKIVLNLDDTAELVTVKLVPNDQVEKNCILTRKSIVDGELEFSFTLSRPSFPVDSEFCPDVDAHVSSKCSQKSVASLLPELQTPCSMKDVPIGPDEVVSIPLFGHSQGDRHNEFFHFTLKQRTSSLDKRRPMLLWAKDIHQLVETQLSSSNQGPLRYSTSPFWFPLYRSLPPYSILGKKLGWFKEAEVEASLCLIGQQGSGKTHNAILLAGVARLYKRRSSLYLDCERFREKYSFQMKTLVEQLITVFRTAAKERAVLIIDGIESLCPGHSDGVGDDDPHISQRIDPTAISQSKLISDIFLQLLHSSRQLGASFIVTTCDTSLLHPNVNHILRFFVKIRLPILDEDEKVLAMTQMLKNSTIDLFKNTNMPVSDRVRMKVKSFNMDDIKRFVTHVTAEVQNHSVMMECMEAEIETFRPSSHAVAALDDTLSRGTVVGGLFSAKKDIESVILRPLRYNRIYSKSKIGLPRGLLLYGPPGCGKTHLIPWISRNSHLPVVSCRGPELIDKYIGSSEHNIRNLFDRAYSVAPSVLFIDELDSLAPRRGSDHTGVTDRIVNQLLTFLDGVEGPKGEVYIIGATSRPDKVDSALLRPGRLEKHIYVGLPTSFEEWVDVIRAVSNSFPLAMDASNWLYGTDTRRLYDVCPHLVFLSPADIHSVFCTAQMKAVNEALDNGRNMDSITVESKHVIAALESSQPSLPEAERELFHKYHAFLRAGTSRTHAESDSLDSRMKKLDTLRTMLK